MTSRVSSPALSTLSAVVKLSIRLSWSSLLASDILIAQGTFDLLFFLFVSTSATESQLHISFELLFDPSPQTLLMEEMLAWRLDNILSLFISFLERFLTDAALSLILELQLPIRKLEWLQNLLQLALFLSSPLEGRVQISRRPFLFGVVPSSQEPHSLVNLLKEAMDECDDNDHKDHK